MTLIIASRAITNGTLHLPKDRRSTSKFGASSSSHSRLHGQFSVICELTTHGLLHIRYLEKKSLYVTVESMRSIAFGMRASSSTGHKPLSISMNVDMTECRSSSSDLASKLSRSQHQTTFLVSDDDASLRNLISKSLSRSVSRSTRVHTFRTT